MTKKQIQILDAAIELFSKQGYHATSTAKIGMEAGVSEALIFRHFKNKEGLLKAIANQIEVFAKQLHQATQIETDPRALLKLTISLPLQVKVDKNLHKYYRIAKKLNWEIENFQLDLFAEIRLELSQAFKQLRYKNPDQESMTLLLIVQGLIDNYLHNKSFDLAEAVLFMQKKYGLI